MSSPGAADDMRLTLTLLYVHRAPCHYVARLGRSGWLEGWGWIEDEALSELARRVSEEGPAELLTRNGTGRASIATWLAEAARVTAPMLED